MTFRREDFNLLRELLGGVPWGISLGGQRNLGLLEILKKDLLKAQKWSIPLSKKPEQQKNNLVKESSKKRACKR